MAEKMKALEREVRELKQANEILRKASAYFAPSRDLATQGTAGRRDGARPPIQTMIRFIEDHRDDLGVETICSVLPIAPATFYGNMAKRADPSRLSDRAKRDEQLKPEIERVFEQNLKIYGLDLSRFRAAPSARLSHLPFESDRAFPAQC